MTASNDFLLKLWNTKVLIEKRDQQDELKPRVTFTGHTTTINDVKYKVRLLFVSLLFSTFSSIQNMQSLDTLLEIPGS